MQYPRAAAARSHIGANIIFLLTISVFMTLQPLHARVSRQWGYQEMFDRSDLVVIATVISTKDAGARVTLPDYVPLLNVIPVITEFEVKAAFKGGKAIKKFSLFHYRYESEDEQFESANNPELIKIDPDAPGTFLLFLTKDRAGRYVPVTGQTDPTALSVLDLRGGAN